jgi:Na+/melibiose symporter-like transporter
MARTEVAEELRKSRSAAMMLGAGALMLIFSVLFVLLAIVYALSLVMAAWAAALIVGVAVGVIAAMCCVAGVRKFKTLRAAPRTVESVKENVQWAKQLTR